MRAPWQNSASRHSVAATGLFQGFSHGKFRLTCRPRANLPYNELWKYLLACMANLTSREVTPAIAVEPGDFASQPPQWSGLRGMWMLMDAWNRVARSRWRRSSLSAAMDCRSVGSAPTFLRRSCGFGSILDLRFASSGVLCGTGRTGRCHRILNATFPV